MSTRPGQMQLARTAMVSRSGARQAVNRTTPALATAYSGEMWLAVPSPAVEAMLMIAPPPRSRIGARTSCVASMTARRFRSSARSHVAGSAVGKHGSSLPPALLTSTPSGPAAATAARTPASDATSAGTNDPPIRAAVAGPACSSRSAMTTCMPSAASRSAIPAPIPSAPPVTRAVLPLRYMAALSVLALTILWSRRRGPVTSHRRTPRGLQCCSPGHPGRTCCQCSRHGSRPSTTPWTGCSATPSPRVGLCG